MRQGAAVRQGAAADREGRNTRTPHADGQERTLQVGWKARILQAMAQTRTPKQTGSQEHCKQTGRQENP